MKHLEKTAGHKLTRNKVGGVHLHPRVAKGVHISVQATSPCVIQCFVAQLLGFLSQLPVLLRDANCVSCPSMQVVKIERIQHAKLWRRFALRRSELVEARGRNGEPTACSHYQSRQCRVSQHPAAS